MIDRETLLTAARLVDQLDAQRKAEHAALMLGWRLGYFAGYEQGARDNDNEHAEWWRAKLGTWHGPSHDTLMRRRYPPDGDKWRWVRHRDEMCPGMPGCDGEHEKPREKEAS